jgi:hypothetical protein
MDDLDKQLREMGCPYEASDYRATVWLDGYQACVKADLERLKADAPQITTPYGVKADGSPKSLEDCG